MGIFDGMSSGGKSSGWGSGSQLLTVGTDEERALTAIGALRAFSAWEEEALAVYPTMFSRGFLQYGVMGVSLGLLEGSGSDPVEVVEEFAAGLFEGDPAAASTLAIARSVAAGSGYRVSLEPVAIGREEWLALLAVGTAFVGRFAQVRGLELPEVLEALEIELVRRSQ